MRFRMLALAMLPLLFLTACDPNAGTPPPDEVPGDTTGGPPALELAATDVMGVTAVATSADGAVLDIQLVVHAPEPFRDRKSTRLNSSHVTTSRMPSSA